MTYRWKCNSHGLSRAGFVTREDALTEAHGHMGAAFGRCRLEITPDDSPDLPPWNPEIRTPIDLEAIRQRNEARQAYNDALVPGGWPEEMNEMDAVADIDALLAEVERLRAISGVSADVPMPGRTPPAPPVAEHVIFRRDSDGNLHAVGRMLVTEGGTRLEVL